MFSTLGTLPAPGREVVLEAWKIPVACSCFTEAVLCRQPQSPFGLKHEQAERESVTSQEPHESNSSRLPWICSSYTVSTGACSAKEIKTSTDSKDFLEGQLINDIQRVELISW